MLTKDQKRKIKDLWNDGLKRRDRSLLIQSWELFQAIDPNDKKFERELRELRNQAAIEKAYHIEQAVLKVMREQISYYTEDNAILFHDAFPNDSENYKDTIDVMLSDIAKEMKKSPVIKQVDVLYEDLAYEEIPYTTGGWD